MLRGPRACTLRAGAGVALAAAGIVAIIGLSASSVRAQRAPAAAGAMRQITDAAGRHLTIPATVRRVADAWPANNAILLMLGAADKLVATSEQARRQPWLRRLYPRIVQVPAAFNGGGDVNIETLVGARPDLVLMAYGGALPRWAAAVESFHIPIVLMSNSSLADLKQTVLMTGEALGPREAAAAQDYVRYFDDNIRTVTRITDKLPPGARPKVLHTASAGILTVDGRQSVIDDWIRIAGGVNAAEVAGLDRPVTMEQVVAWNPDVIIVGTAPNRQSRQAILDDPRWREIKAVRDGRVYVNPSGAYLWDRHSAEAALQVLWAAKLLHPAKFASLDVNEATKKFYARFFHYRLTDAELRSIMEATAP